MGFSEEGELLTYFVDCTCEHYQEDHGWGNCDIEGCPCEGGWEE